MISKSKPGMLALVAMIGIVTPALAQGLETGTAANTYGWNSPRANAITGEPSGLRAFARVPRAHVRSGLHTFARVPRAHFRSLGVRTFDMAPGAFFSSHSPSATGGGSIGYNSYVGRDS